MNRRLGWTLALLATITYSTNTPIGRGAILAGLDPVTLLAARFALAGFLFGATLGVTSVGTARSGQTPLDRRGFWIALASGMLNGVMIACIFIALTRVSASVNSMITIALIPAFTLLLLAWRGEPLTARNLVRLGIGLAGLYLLIGVGGRVDPWGVLLLVVGSALYAIHMVSVQWFLRPYNTWMITTLIVVGAGVVLACMWLARGADAPLGHRLRLQLLGRLHDRGPLQQPPPEGGAGLRRLARARGEPQDPAPVAYPSHASRRSRLRRHHRPAFPSA